MTPTRKSNYSCGIFRDRTLLPERLEGGFAQKDPVLFSRNSAQLNASAGLRTARPGLFITCR